VAFGAIPSLTQRRKDAKTQRRSPGSNRLFALLNPREKEDRSLAGGFSAQSLEDSGLHSICPRTVFSASTCDHCIWIRPSVFSLCVFASLRDHSSIASAAIRIETFDDPTWSLISSWMGQPGPNDTMHQSPRSTALTCVESTPRVW
jgi:hypothetical protein